MADEREDHGDFSAPRVKRVRWWPQKWAVPTRPNGEGKPVIFTQYAWWQWRKRRRMSDVRNLERFDWRTIRLSFRRPADHWRNDPPSN